MPGKRNFARERAAHAAHAADRQSQLYAMLRTQLPDLDVALVGWPAILTHLHRFGLRRLSGGPLTIRIVRRWIARDAFPVLRGNSYRYAAASPVSTAHALSAWILTRFCAGDLFTVVAPAPGVPATGSFTPSTHAARAA